MTYPKPGTRVRVWPLHPRVQADEHPVGPKFAGRFMADDGHDVIWSHFHVALLRSGAICLHDPKPAPAAKAVPVKSSSQDSMKVAG